MTLLTGKQVVVFGDPYTFRMIDPSLTAHGASVTAIDSEEADSPDVNAVMFTLSKVPDFDVAVLTAAYRTWGEFLHTSDDDWQQAVELNIEKMVYCLQAAARRMIEVGRGGHIIALLSATALMPFIGTSMVGTTHNALWAIMKMAAVDLAPHGITCNGIALGWSEQEAWLQQRTQEQRAHIQQGIPVGRLANSDDLGSLIAFLASDAAAYLNGALIPLDGGYTLTRSDGESAFEL